LKPGSRAGYAGGHVGQPAKTRRAVIYAVIAHQGADVLGASIAHSYPDNYPFRPSCWFVDEPGSAEAVSVRLGIDSGRLPGVQAVVLPVTNYHGFAAGGLWDWLHSHWPG
jgi:hypothetical protein